MPADDPAPRPKEVKLQIRLDSDLADKVAAKARRYGGASAVIRALLRRWVTQDIVTADDVLAEMERAQQRPPRKSKE